MSFPLAAFMPFMPGKRSEYQAAGKFFPQYQRPDGFSAVGSRAGGSLVFRDRLGIAELMNQKF